MEQCYSRAAPVDYRAVIIAECTRGRLRGRGAHLSVTAKSTAFNAVDSGRGGIHVGRSESWLIGSILSAASCSNTAAVAAYFPHGNGSWTSDIASNR